ncbi:hypothetical protein IQ224_19325 [Microcystis sp. LEGE 00066]|uniref:hypothetical protein n=1 Tax=Microcystis sp. LEGE 00066 TaxID=1828685 RepID=UPI001880285E|nr:hypothetical protein [Microcystis sp. LEGE 00066]MBE9264201.1 hypothetical protein [Microcystis sp. LEGE 00066]
MSITPSEELLEYEQARAIKIWEAPLSLETRSALSEIAIPKAKGAPVGEDMGVGNNVNNDGSILPPLPQSLRKFKSWLGVAATINRKAYQTARLDPTKTSFDGATWSDYDYKFRSAPFWENCTSKNRNANITELSLTPLIDAIANLVQAFVTPTGFDDIVTSVKKIGELAVKNVDQNQKDTYEQSGLITISASKLYVCNTRTQVSFTYYEGKGYQQLAQTLNVQTCVATLDFGKCERSAGQILQWDQTDVDAWVTSTSSNDQPPNTSPAWDH